MRIRTETTASATSLTEYLRRCECIVETVDARTIEVRVAAGSLAARHEQVELEGYLLVWHAMHPDGRVERLTQPAVWEVAARACAGRCVESVLGAVPPQVLAVFERALDPLAPTRSFERGGEIDLRPPPNANAYAERWVRTVRTDCLDRILILGRRHLEHVLRIYRRTTTSTGHTAPSNSYHRMRANQPGRTRPIA